MQSLEELERMFLEKIKPYEERMKQLEDTERENNIEIATLKNAVMNLNKTIDQLRLKTQKATTPSYKSSQNDKFKVKAG